MECEICKNPWNIDKRVPKILVCGHTFCQSCINQTLEESKKKKTPFKCPLCKVEINSILEYKDITQLRNNIGILSLIEKMEIQKIKTNTSNNSMSISLQINNSPIINNENNIQNVENLVFKTYNMNINDNKNENQLSPLCQIHKNKANFYIIEKDNIIFICNDCLRIEKYNNLLPLPNLKINNEYKINSCKNKIKILFEEIKRIENFLNSYQDKFEAENIKKLKELFDFIKNIIKYNITTAKTLFNQCKKEQKNNIDKKIEELSFLKKELDLFNTKLDDLLYLNKINPLPESQIELDNIYNKLGNYINYENELNLFTMNISIKDEIKNSLFEIIQNSYKLDIDFLKMKNGELPTIKDLLNTSKNWSCSCGNINNKEGKIICDCCSKYRSLETYTNILFNPMIVTKKEKKEYQMRRNHEWKVFQNLIKKNIHTKKNNYCFAIDCSWFNRWKSFIANDLDERILSNKYKNISENINLGVLPPGQINNKKICDETSEIDGANIFKLKRGLTINKDYVVVNQLLWEWFLLNYDGGPEIIMESDQNSINNLIFKDLKDIMVNKEADIKNNNDINF